MSYGFGTRDYSQGVYGGYSDPFSLSAIPVIIEHYDNQLGYLGAFQSGVGDFLGCEFTLDESGPKDFILYFAKSVGIEKEHIIKIKIFNSDDYFFTGVVRTVPIEGSTKAEYNYSGYGLNDYIYRYNAESKSYIAQTIEEILDDLVDNILVVETPIQKNSGKIKPPNITVGSFDINYSELPNVFDTLKKIANSDGDNRYATGVDETGEFFFLPKSEETKVTLVVGKKGKYGIDNYEPEEDIQAVTNIYILEDDGTFIDEKEASDTRLLAKGVSKKKVVAPDVDNTSAERLAEGEIAEINYEYNSRRASIQWKIEESSPLQLLADGNIRIINNIPSLTTMAPNPNPYGSGTYSSGLYGGGQYTGKDIDDTLEVKEVRYVITSAAAIRDIQIGGLPPRLEKEILVGEKDISDLRISLGR
jgi:hypothetical protein